jgi:hypothetical protein
MRTFIFDQYRRQQAVAENAVLLTARVWLDGETYVILPNPKDESRAYRVAKDDVRIVDVLPAPDQAADGEPHYSLLVRKDAQCLQMSAGKIAKFWSETLDETRPLAATLRVDIRFQANGEGTLIYAGNACACLGKPGLPYPQDLTVNVEDKYRRRYSNEFNAWMDFAVLIWGQRGIFIHEGAVTLASNGGETAGCIHLASPQAEAFFNWVATRTRIVISYPW